MSPSRQTIGEPKEVRRFSGRMRTESGAVLRVTILRNKQGLWRIAAVGNAKGPTAFLPFSCMDLVYVGPFASLDDAKLAVRAA